MTEFTWCSLGINKAVCFSGDVLLGHMMPNAWNIWQWVCAGDDISKKHNTGTTYYGTAKRFVEELIMDNTAQVPSVVEWNPIVNSYDWECFVNNRYVGRLCGSSTDGWILKSVLCGGDYGTNCDYLDDAKKHVE